MLKLYFDSYHKKTKCPIFTRIDCCGSAWLETTKDKNGDWYYNDGNFVLSITATKNPQGLHLVKVREALGQVGKFKEHETFWKAKTDIFIKESNWSD